MKSMLHEASSIFKAIEKAWEQSGKPEQFSIKILERGKQGFLWFGGSPAIVSITYDPKQSSLRPTNGKVTHHNNQQRPQERKQHPSSHQQRPQQAATKQEPLRTVGITPKEKTHTSARPEARLKTNSATHHTTTASHTMPQQEQTVWTQEFADQIATWLQELSSTIIGSRVAFTTKIDGKNLHIAFASALLDSRENEKNLFMSLAYLLIQALKKKCKKKLRGFHLLITSPASHRDVEYSQE